MSNSKQKAVLNFTEENLDKNLITDIDKGNLV